MAANLPTLVPASEKAKNVATETYVDSSTGDIINNIYLTGTTTIDGGKIATDSITAAQINTIGLVAENIQATELYGKNLYGSYIEGAVIKASYLDLDGEIQVLTNYHLWVTQADMDAGIAAGQKGELYTNEIDMVGAIYLSGQDEWRLPSTSYLTIYAGNKNFPVVADAACEFGYKIVNGTFLSQDDTFGSFKSYEIATSRRFVKDKPLFTITGGGTIGFGKNIYYDSLSDAPNWKLWFANIDLGSITDAHVSGDTLYATYKGQQISVSTGAVNVTYTNSITIVTNGISVKLTITAKYYDPGAFTNAYNIFGVSLGLTEGDHTPTVDITTKGAIRVQYVGTTTCSGTVGKQFTFPELTVNNMI